jgi:hypothetical protein
VTFPLLLDEMFADTIAQQLCAKGHDVLAVVADPSLISLPDDQILARTAATGRALVTANIKDFMPLDAQYRAAEQAHAGLILVSAKTFPQNSLVVVCSASARASTACRRSGSSRTGTTAEGALPSIGRPRLPSARRA